MVKFYDSRQSQILKDHRTIFPPSPKSPITKMIDVVVLLLVLFLLLVMMFLLLLSLLLWSLLLIVFLLLMSIIVSNHGSKY